MTTVVALFEDGTMERVEISDLRLMEMASERRLPIGMGDMIEEAKKLLGMDKSKRVKQFSVTEDFV